MIGITAAADAQFDALFDAYVRDENNRALELLVDSFAAAASLIEGEPANPRRYPSTYTELSRYGFYWIRHHSYWYGYDLSLGYPIITNIFYVTSDMPNSVRGMGEYRIV